MAAPSFLRTMSEKKEGPPTRNVTADEATRRGAFSNQAIVTHDGEQFNLDFCFFSPLHPTQGQLVSRIILSPGHAKRFLVALRESVRKYEERFGELPEPDPADLAGPPVVQ